MLVSEGIHGAGAGVGGAGGAGSGAGAAGAAGTAATPAPIASKAAPTIARRPASSRPVVGVGTGTAAPAGGNGASRPGSIVSGPAAIGSIADAGNSGSAAWVQVWPHLAHRTVRADAVAMAVSATI